MLDVNAISEQIVKSVKGYVSRSLEAFENKFNSLINDLRERQAVFVSKLADVEQRFVDLPKPVDGRDGVDGKDGSPGVDGRNGLDGSIGPEGPAGARGADGRDGVDGAPGPQGERGVDGATGPVGSPGEMGPAGLKGADGKDGEPGAMGPAGLKGADGKDGVDGLPGRDAIELQVLPNIDAEKNYPRGTVAVYRGGTIRAVRRTSPIRDSLETAGWQVLMNGIAECDVVINEGARSSTIRFVLTDGQVVERIQKSSAPFYLGVWREGKYEQASAVTFGGSVFIAHRDTDAKPGTNDSGWQLAVKAGRDGKDGKDGQKGDKGADGKDGRKY